MANKDNYFKQGFDSKRFVPVNNGLVAFHTELASLLRNQSLDAVNFMIDTMNNEKASLVLRMRAAEQILDRGIGRPVDRTVVATMDAGTAQDVTKLNTEELEAIIAKLDVKEPVIDADFEEVEENQ